MSSLPKRHEIPKEHQWRLEDLFENQEAWDKEYEESKRRCKNSRNTKASFMIQDAEDVFCAGRCDLLTYRAAVRVCEHAHHENMADPTYQALSDKAKKLSVEVSEATSFITPEVLSLPEETTGCADRRS